MLRGRRGKRALVNLRDGMELQDRTISYQLKYILIFKSSLNYIHFLLAF